MEKFWRHLPKTTFEEKTFKRFHMNLRKAMAKEPFLSWYSYKLSSRNLNLNKDINSTTNYFLTHSIFTEENYILCSHVVVVVFHVPSCTLCITIAHRSCAPQHHLHNLPLLYWSSILSLDVYFATTLELEKSST